MRKSFIMVISTIAAILAMSLVCRVAEADSREITPTWLSIEELPPDDSAFAKEMIRYLIDFDAIRDLSDEFEHKFVNDIQAALLITADGSDIMLLTWPSLGNCGDIILTVFGSKTPEGKRPRLLHQCFTDLRLRSSSSSPMPEIATSIGYSVDLIMTWDGSGWNSEHIVERPSIGLQTDMPWEQLISLEGTHEFATLLQQPRVRATLKEGMKNDYLLLLKNLAKVGSLSHSEDCLIGGGIASDSFGGVEIAVCADGGIHVALDDSHSVLYSTAADKIPAAIRDHMDRRPRGGGWEYVSLPH